MNPQRGEGRPARREGKAQPGSPGLPTPPAGTGCASRARGATARFQLPSRLGPARPPRLSPAALPARRPHGAPRLPASSAGTSCPARAAGSGRQSRPCSRRGGRAQPGPGSGSAPRARGSLGPVVPPGPRSPARAP